MTLQQEKQKVDQQAVLAHADLINSLKDQSGLMEEDVGQLEVKLPCWMIRGDIKIDFKFLNKGM